MSDPRHAAWAPYRPGAAAPWNLRRVVHLHRRAGFAASWGEIQRDLAEGPQASLDRVLGGKVRTGAADFERTAGLLADAAREPERLKAWWVYRMLFGPDPLGERLTLMWHNHFATSALRIRDLTAMRRQNDLFRDLARAPFGKLLHGAVRDPALLVWLDAPANRKGHPNENLGRELMELFTLGIGHYTETDVKEAARALTGWGSGRGFGHDPAEHDGGEKTILGRTGRWGADDLVRLLLDHPATAERLARRLCEQFLGEGAADAAAVESLSAGLREHDLDVGWAVAVVLRSQAFFADANLGTHVIGPVEYVVGAARALEITPSTYLLGYWAGQLGQDLFFPPNVGGWPGGRSWITARTMIGRAKYAAALVDGSLGRPREPLDVLALAGRHGRSGDLAALVTFTAELLRGAPPTSAERDALLAALEPGAAATSDTARRAVALILATPAAQLG
jgi:uncharacterized protein (DUF1800 family)